jgi:hypothetical protein
LLKRLVAGFPPRRPARGICGGQSGAGVGFLRVLRFPLPIFIPPISPQSPSPIIWGWYNRPVSGLSTKSTTLLEKKTSSLRAYLYTSGFNNSLAQVLKDADLNNVIVFADMTTEFHSFPPGSFIIDYSVPRHRSRVNAFLWKCFY